MSVVDLQAVEAGRTREPVLRLPRYPHSRASSRQDMRRPWPGSLIRQATASSSVVPLARCTHRGIARHGTSDVVPIAPALSARVCDVGDVDGRAVVTVGRGKEISARDCLDVGAHDGRIDPRFSPADRADSRVLDLNLVKRIVQGILDPGRLGCGGSRERHKTQRHDDRQQNQRPRPPPTHFAVSCLHFGRVSAQLMRSQSWPTGR